MVGGMDGSESRFSAKGQGWSSVETVCRGAAAGAARAHLVRGRKLALGAVQLDEGWALGASAGLLQVGSRQRWTGGNRDKLAA